MTSCAEQYERVCKDGFAAIHSKLDKLDEAIRGNGKPGILLRLDRLESVRAIRARLVWIAAGSAGTLVVGVILKLIF